jgi:hypothetical protein
LKLQQFVNICLVFQDEDILLTNRFFVPLKLFEAMKEVLQGQDLAFIQQKEGEERSSKGIEAATTLYVERMFTLEERLTFSENVPPKVHEKLLEIEGTPGIDIRSPQKTIQPLLK